MTGSVYAFRCNGKIVDVGLNKYEVLSRCGEPAFKDRRVEYRVTSSNNKIRRLKIVVDEWVYDFGANIFIRILKFESGGLVSIKLGGYGKNESETVNNICAGTGVSLGNL